MATTRAIGDADTRIVQAVYRYHYLKPEQILRLLYSPGSKTYVREHLSQLTEQNILIRTYLYQSKPWGSAPSVYSVGAKGLRLLRSLGEPVSARARKSEVLTRSPEYLRHVLAINDFLISIVLLCRDAPDYCIAQLRYEQDLKRLPMHVQIPNWDGADHRYTLIPDSWIDLYAGEDRYCMLLELDRCTEEQKKWKQKVRAIVAAMEGAYRKMFGTDSLTVAVVIVKNEGKSISPGSRMENLLQWTEEELENLREQDKAELFCFYADDGSQHTPSALFHEPCWYQPFTATPIALLG